MRTILLSILTLSSIFTGCSPYTLIYDDTPEYRQKFYSENIYGYVNKKKYFESKDISIYLEQQRDSHKKPLQKYMNDFKKEKNAFSF